MQQDGNTKLEYIGQHCKNAKLAYTMQQDGNTKGNIVGMPS
jgi:hypothetical protein